MAAFSSRQMLCHESCLSKGILEAQESTVMWISVLRASNNALWITYRSHLWTLLVDLHPVLNFAGKAGPAPYLHILRWLADANDWSLSLDRIIRTQQELRGSISQVVEKHHLEHLLDSSPDFSEVLHYDKSTRTLTVEDPQFVFFLSSRFVDLEGVRERPGGWNSPPANRS